MSIVWSVGAQAGAAVVLKVTAVLAAGALAAALMRGRSAAMRHLVWMVALAGALAVPVFQNVLPMWRVAVFPASSTAVTVADAAAPAREDNRVAPQARVAREPAETAVREVANAPSDTLADRSFGWTWPRALFLLWLSGVLAVVTWLFTGVTGAWLLARRANSVTDPEWLDLFARLCEQVGVQRRVRLLEVPTGVTPMTCGVFAPVVLVPECAVDWTDARRRVVLLHELAHIRRADVLTQMIAQLVCAVYWFHPLAWYAAARMRAERERACDDAVVSAGERASDYATHLLEVARSYRATRMLQPAALAMARSSQLEGRLLAVLRPGLNRTRVTGTRAVVSALAGLAVVVPISALTPTTRNAPLPAVQQSADVIRHPQPATPLVQRWEWAFNEAAQRNARRGFWIAYSIERQARGNQQFAGGSTGFDLDDLKLAPLQTQLFGTRPLRNDRAGSALAPHTVALLVRFGRGATSLADAQEMRQQSMSVGINLRNLPVYWLGGASDPQSVAWLEREYHGDGPEWLRDELVEAIGLHQTASVAVPALQRIMVNAGATTRAEAAEALGDQGSPEALRVLRDVVRNDPAENVRGEAAEALGQSRDAGATRALLQVALSDDALAVRSEAAEALGDQETEEAARALGSLIFDNDVPVDVQAQATEALGNMPADMSYATLERVATEHPSWRIRAEAAETLAELPPALALPLLERIIFNDRDPRVQEDAVEALGDLGRPARALLTRVLRSHPDADVRARAAEVEADNENKAEREQDPAPEIDPDARFDSPSPSASASSSASPSPSASPGSTGEEVPGDIEESSLITRAQARRARDAQAINALLDNLDHVRQHRADLVRERSVWALSLVENGEIVLPLINKLNDSDWRVRAYAAWALAAAADSRAASALIDASMDPHWRVRMHAMVALGALPVDDASRDALLDGLKDKEWQVRVAAVEVLAHDPSDDPDIQKALRRAAGDPHALVREAASSALVRS